MPTRNPEPAATVPNVSVFVIAFNPLEAATAATEVAPASISGGINFPILLSNSFFAS